MIRLLPHALLLGCVAHAGPDPGPATADMIARDPIRDREVAACRECDGIWEAARLGGEFCNCRTKDAGATCHRSRDCEGYCIPTGLETTKTEGDDAWVIPVGRCSERASASGCRHELPYDELPAPMRRRKHDDPPWTLPSVCS